MKKGIVTKFECIPALLALGLIMGSAQADVQLPAIFGDNMVLQSGVPVPVWGWAEPGERVCVTVAGQTAQTTAHASGEWKVILDPLSTGGPLEVQVVGVNSINITNVLVGEVWICSGQSNMQWPVSRSTNAIAEVAAAQYPRMRLFSVTRTVSIAPLDDCEGSWVECTPDSVPPFSAVGYYFGRNIHQALDVPVGLIHTSWGGTPAQAWASRAALEADEELASILEGFEDSLTDFPAALKRYEQQMKEYGETQYFQDPGNVGFDKGWASPDHDVSTWKEINVPGAWELQGLKIDGVLWFRKEVTIPDAWAGKELSLSLGSIDDCDVTYFNGIEIGSVGEDTENFWSVLRRYKVPASAVKAGKAVLAVRVFDRWMSGGFTGAADAMQLGCPSEDVASIALAGTWRYQTAAQREEPTQSSQPPRKPLGPDSPHAPSGLYGAMINPLVPYALRGAIWYQGESNASRAYQYRKLFPVMIESWRTAWGCGPFPFLFVQLANFMAVQTEPAEASAWAELREAQLMTLRLTNTAMAVAIDVGEAKDIHPKDKQTVGLRLGLAAQATVYGKDVVFSGPIYEGAVFGEGKATITFKHVGGGLVARDGKTLTGFAVAGEDQQFVAAQAEIEDGAVTVSSKDVPHPVAVRYGWANNPVCNLYNRENLPATPFRTDDWPGVTADSK